MIRLLTLAIIAILSWAAPAHAMERQGPHIVESFFGIFEKSDGAAHDLAKTNTIPLRPGVKFGWVIRLDTQAGIVRWREEYTQPAAPKTWGAQMIGTRGMKRTISADGRTSDIEREERISNGILLGAWEISEGDPPGLHVIRVTLENGETAEFKFLVQE